MKNLTFLLLALLFSTSIYSQNFVHPVKQNLGIPDNFIAQELSKNSQLLKSTHVQNQEYIWADSIITFMFTSPTDSSNSGKEYHVVDEQGRQIRAEYWTWNDYLQLWSISAVNLEYPGDTEIYTYLNWNTDSNAFIPSGKAEMTTREGYFSNSYFSYITDSKSFVGVSKDETWFNDEGNDSLKISNSFNAGMEQWENTQRTEYRYDSLQNQIEDKRFNWENNSWKVAFKLESGYDTLNNLTYKNQYMVYLGSLYNNVRRTYAYDSLNNLTNERVMLYNNNVWVNSNNNLYHFDEMSREILYLTQIWDTDLNLWKHQTKYVTEYSEGTKRTSYNWDDGIQDWITLSEQTSIFNDDSSTKWWGKSWDVSSNDWIGFWSHENTLNTEFNVVMKYAYSSKNSDGEEWNLNTVKYYYYNGINVFQKAPVLPEKQFAIYPNPANNFIFITKKNPANIKLQVYNLTGQLIMNRNLTELQNTINITELDPGQYIFKIYDKNVQEIHKILKVSF